MTARARFRASDGLGLGARCRVSDMIPRGLHRNSSLSLPSGTYTIPDLCTIVIPYPILRRGGGWVGGREEERRGGEGGWVGGREEGEGGREEGEEREEVGG